MKISVLYDNVLAASEQKKKDISDVIAHMKALGIDYIDIEDKVLRNNENNIKEILEENNMKIGCIYAMYDIKHIEDTARGYELIDMAVSVQCSNVLIVPGFGAERYNTICEALKKICEYASKVNVHVTLKDYDNKKATYSTTAGVLQYMDNVHGLKCTFDTGNFIYSEENAVEAFHKLKGSIVHVHLKDRCLSRKPGELARYTIEDRAMYSSAVGYGCIAMTTLVRLLLENGYDGIYTIVVGDSMHMYDDIALSVQWIQRKIETILARER